MRKEDDGQSVWWWNVIFRVTAQLSIWPTLLMSQLYANIWISVNPLPVHSITFSDHFPLCLLFFCLRWHLVRWWKVERLSALMTWPYHFIYTFFTISSWEKTKYKSFKLFSVKFDTEILLRKFNQMSNFIFRFWDRQIQVKNYAILKIIWQQQIFF